MTTLLRDAAGVAVPDVDLTMVVERPDGVEYRRTVVPDQGLGGRSLNVPIISSAPTGTWRVAVYSDPKQPSIGEASFLVEDYVPDRLEFDLTTDGHQHLARRARQDHARRALPLRRAGGGPRHRGRGQHRQGRRSVRAIPAMCSGSNAKDEPEEDEVATEAIPLADLPQTDDQGKATFTVDLGKLPASTQAARGEHQGAAGRAGRPGGASASSRFPSCPLRT